MHLIFIMPESLLVAWLEASMYLLSTTKMYRKMLKLWPLGLDNAISDGS